MAFWVIVEVLVAIAVVVFIATQVLIPVFAGKPVFPIFETRKEEDILTEIAGEIEKEKLRIAAEKLADELAKLRRRKTDESIRPPEGT